MRKLTLLALVFPALLLPCSSSRAQALCLDWRDGFCLPGADNDVFCLGNFNDGSGPGLFVGGTFRDVSNRAARCLARWDGTDWTEVGGGIGINDPLPVVRCMLTFDDGTGPALYVGGTFTDVGGLLANGIARWDGSQWTALGNGLPGVTALAVFDDGQGARLYAGKDINGGVFKWDGTQWTLVGTNGAGGEITALQVFDDGSGPALYASGSFTYFDGPANRIAKWDGSSWSALAGGMNATIFSLAVWNDGQGEALYAGGSFSNSLNNSYCIAKWDGANWSWVDGGLTAGGGQVRSLSVFDDGTGSALFVAGAFHKVGFSPGVLADNIAKWNGSIWTALGNGTSHLIQALGKFDDGSGSGEHLIVGGGFNRAGGEAVLGLAAWRGAWSSVGFGAGLEDRVRTMAVYDDGLGGGPALFMGGDFEAAGGASDVRFIGKWTGTNLSAVGQGPDGNIFTLVTFDDGTGLQLYAGGHFFTTGGQPVAGVARWNGTAWSSAGAGFMLTVNRLFLYDEGAGLTLYAVTGPLVHRWTGTTWVDAGWDPQFLIGTTCVFDDGAGPRLYAAGTQSGTTSGAFGVRRLDGTTWTLIGLGCNDVPTSLTVFDDGAGPKLHAFGRFTTIGGQPVLSAARWNGTAWTQLGGGIAYPGLGTPVIPASAVWDEHMDQPARLYVAGKFTQADGQPVHNIAVWDGSTWSDVAGGTDDQINAITVFEQGGGPDMYVGGLFRHAGNLRSERIAHYSSTCSLLVGATQCYGDGSGTGCPCGNDTAAGAKQGCMNSIGGGGTLRAVGKPSGLQDSLELQVSGVPNSAALYFQGTAMVNGGAGVAFGDGLRCVGGNVLRIGTQTNLTGGSVYPSQGDVAISNRGGISNFGGVTRFYQAWYRNASAFCTPSTYNLTNAIGVFWIP